MDTQRKLQLSAAAVIANGLVVLGAMAPSSAFAAACSDHSYAVICDGCTSSCMPVSGCTLTKMCFSVPPCEFTVSTVCGYS